MNSPALHHVSLVTLDLDRSVKFYRDVFGLKQIARPPFKSAGAWLALGPMQLHLIVKPDGTFRTKPAIETGDAHFAIRVSDFEKMIGQLVSKGFRENAADGDPMRLLVIRKGVAGFPQAYILDPDWNIIEINAAE